MTKIGKFIVSKFKNKEIEIFTSNENEFVHYSDADALAWTLIKAIVVDYDEESGVITLKSIMNRKIFYIDESKIEMFWEPGFNISECTSNTKRALQGGKKNRDIM